MITSVFLSYATVHPDRQVAVAIHDALTKSGIKLPIWRDRERLNGGERFSEKIAKAIVGAESFLFLLSPRSLASKWCRRELARADRLDKPIVPLLLEEIPHESLPLELERLQYVDFRKGARQGVSELRKALGATATSDDILDDPAARDDRLVEALAQAFRYGDVFAPAPNIGILVKQVGSACAETSRAQRVFKRLIPAEHSTGQAAASWLLDTWNGPPVDRQGRGRDPDRRPSAARAGGSGRDSQ